MQYVSLYVRHNSSAVVGNETSERNRERFRNKMQLNTERSQSSKVTVRSSYKSVIQQQKEGSSQNRWGQENVRISIKFSFFTFSFLFVPSSTRLRLVGKRNMVNRIACVLLPRTCFKMVNVPLDGCRVLWAFFLSTIRILTPAQRIRVPPWNTVRLGSVSLYSKKQLHDLEGEFS